MADVHFDERDDAEAFASVLGAEGIACRLHRDEFAGEDDFEDAAWLVEVADSVPALAHRAEEAGGWVVVAPEPPSAAPAPLPAEPRRIKRSQHH
ncbi:hypothetical protein [Aeromicrobium choanae]|uniref:Uncharacterized protein n=1 Tax=Aeromicrobium choanae TaxID=1736691 RepID=A0A1T4YSL1_9ACTN|nr:hypothetical protein [Aeromicrobium choanae]SKB04653.1 hypothetical protein SAMN06295964_0658 [Aeromicrobium choanae]